MFILNIENVMKNLTLKEIKEFIYENYLRKQILLNKKEIIH